MVKLYSYLFTSLVCSFYLYATKHHNIDEHRELTEQWGNRQHFEFKQDGISTTAPFTVPCSMASYIFFSSYNAAIFSDGIIVVAGSR